MGIYTFVVEVPRAKLLFARSAFIPIDLGFGHRVNLGIEGELFASVVDLYQIVDRPAGPRALALCTFGPVSVSRDADIEGKLSRDLRFNCGLMRVVWDFLPEDWKKGFLPSNVLYDGGR